MIRALMSFVVVALLQVALEPSRAGAEPAADPVATVIETRENGLVSRRSVPNSKMLQEAVR